MLPCLAGHHPGKDQGTPFLQHFNQVHKLGSSCVIVQARKPEFWANSQSLYEVVSDDGLMRPVMTAHKGGLYCGGSAVMVERAMQLEGDDILYVGDHIYTGQ